MTIHRFFLPANSFSDGRVEFPSDVSRQIGRVLRLGVGDQVIALDNSGMEYTVRLEAVGSATSGTIVASEPNRAEPPIELILYIGILKAAKLEMVLQKCTEIGVSRFVPMRTERSVATEPGAARQRRFEAIVREAAEQSRRGRMPVVQEAVDFESAIRRSSLEGPTLMLWEEERILHVRDVQVHGSGTVGLFVGSEGGFSRGEAERACELGAQTVSLGHRILRAETAAIVGSALILHWR